MKKTLVCAVVAMFLAVSTEAGLLTFTHEGNGSGTLNGAPFSASDFVITAVGDTANRESYSAGWFIDHSSASILIDGLGDFDILTGTRTFVNNNSQMVGFSRAGIRGADLFDGPTDAQFATWDMLDSTGPISGSVRLTQWTNDPLIDTGGGILKFHNNSGNGMFTAVPEPTTLILLGLGGLVVRKRRTGCGGELCWPIRKEAQRCS